MENTPTDYQAATRTSRRVLAALCSSALVLALAACDKTATEQTVGQKLDAAVDKTEQIAADVKTDASQMAGQAREKMDTTLPQVQSSVENAGAKVGAVMDDAAITAQISRDLLRDTDLSALKIDVDTKAGVVTLTGSAPSDLARERATTIAKTVSGVTGVHNKLVLKTS